MRSTISLPRSASLTMQASASLTSAMFGGLMSNKRMAARAWLRALAFGYVDVSSDHFDKFSIRGEQRTSSRFDVFDRSIGKHDSELECKISFLTQGLLGLYIHSLAIV